MEAGARALEGARPPVAVPQAGLFVENSGAGLAASAGPGPCDRTSPDHACAIGTRAQIDPCDIRVPAGHGEVARPLARRYLDRRFCAPDLKPRRVRSPYGKATAKGADLYGARDRGLPTRAAPAQAPAPATFLPGARGGGRAERDAAFDRRRLRPDLPGSDAARHERLADLRIDPALPAPRQGPHPGAERARPPGGPRPRRAGRCVGLPGEAVQLGGLRRGSPAPRRRGFAPDALR